MDERFLEKSQLLQEVEETQGFGTKLKTSLLGEGNDIGNPSTRALEQGTDLGVRDTEIYLAHLKNEGWTGCCVLALVS